MATNLIVVLAASGLVATGVPQATQTRSASVLPVAKASLVSNAVAPHAAGSSCFVAVGAKSLKQAGVQKCAEAKAGAAPVGGAVASTTSTSTITAALTTAAIVAPTTFVASVAANEVNGRPASSR